MKSVLIIAPYFEPAFLAGGPVRTLAALIRKSSSDRRIRILTSAYDLGVPSPLPVPLDKYVSWEDQEVFYSTAKGLLATIKKFTSQPQREFGIVYLNSLFSFRNSVIPLALHRLGWMSQAAIILAPRGELDPGALALKTRKKRAFISLYRLTRMHRKVVWHASTDAERANIKRQFPDQSRVIVRSNETNLPNKPQPFEPPPSDTLRFVFLSRIVPKKGLHIILQAFEHVTHSCTLDVWGNPEDEAYALKCERLLRRLPPYIKVRMLGPLPHDEVLKRLGNYDYFLFPTQGENFGHVIAESMAAGTPLVVSDNTPWSATVATGGGLVVTDNTPEEWACVLNKTMPKLRENAQGAREKCAAAYWEWSQAQAIPDIFALYEQGKWE